MVIEIGPGLGALTRHLVVTNPVFAIEVDHRLVEELRQSLPSDRLKIIAADALTLDWQALLDEAVAFYKEQCGHAETLRLRVVANLPYYISTPIMERLLAVGARLFDLTLMLQKEVVERITAKPGGKEYGYLSVLVQLHAEAKQRFEVPPSAFRPAPKVRSAIVQLRPRPQLAVKVSDAARFMKLVSISFAQRRKTIANNLKAVARLLPEGKNIEATLQSIGIDPKRRAETLSLDEFAALFGALFDTK